MSITMFTVECSKHGRYDISADSDGYCPRLCPITENRVPCGQNLKRIYNVPAVHFHGPGFTKSNTR